MTRGLSVQETFGAMAKTEKVDFILEQVRLCLERKDYVRCWPLLAFLPWQHEAGQPFPSNLGPEIMIHVMIMSLLGSQSCQSKLMPAIS